MMGLDFTTAAPEPIDRVIYRRELQRQLGGVCSETIRRYIKTGKLPKPDVAMSQKTVGWRVSSLRRHGVDLV